MTVLVTGAGGGIGSAVVRELTSRRQAVVAHDLTVESMAHLGELGVDAVTGDLRRTAVLDEIRAAVGERHLDAVIASHGIDGSGALGTLEPGFVRRVLQINAATLPLLLATTAPLLSGGGRFVVVASQAGLRGEPDNAAYCASKFAAVAWTRAVAPRMREIEIHVRALCPGCTETSLLFAAHERFAAERGLDPQQLLADRRARIPVGRFATTAETAAAALYLAEAGQRPMILAATGGEVPF